MYRALFKVAMASASSTPEDRAACACRSRYWPHDHLGAHRPPLPVQARAVRRTECRLGQQVVRPGERQVTSEDGGRGAEGLRRAVHTRCPVPAGQVDVQGRCASSLHGAVHHVVVDQSARLEQFERGSRSQDGGGVSRAARGAPAAVGERGAQPLAAPGGQRRETVGQFPGEEGVDGTAVAQPFVQYPRRTASTAFAASVAVTGSSTCSAAWATIGGSPGMRSPFSLSVVRTPLLPPGALLWMH